MVNWVVSLNVGLGSTFGLTSLMIYIGAKSEGFKERGQGDVLSTPSLQTKQEYG